MRILEVFSCSGGMAEGLRRAGLHVTMAFDLEPGACASYAANLGHAPIQIDARDLLRMVRAGWSPGPIDLLIADPPCTPWSRAGKRKGTDDERDMLEPTVELIRLLRPRHFLIANVPGLDDGPNWPTVQRTIGSLAPAWCIDFARLDAADYGVPQHRWRPFWYGHRGEREHHAYGSCIRWPARTHCSPEEWGNLPLAGMGGLSPWVTCREALGHLSAEDLGSPVRLRWRGCQGNQVASVPDRPARVVGTSTLSDGNVLAHPDEAVRKTRVRTGTKPRASHADEPAHVVTCRDSSGDGATQPGNRGAVVAWPWDRPATTLTTDSEGRLAPPGHHGKSFLSDNRCHGPNAIKLSEKAAAILQGFPPGWHFVGDTKRSRWSQIGQAMPPPLAAAVARSIAVAMGAKCDEAAE